MCVCALMCDFAQCCGILHVMYCTLFIFSNGERCPLRHPLISPTAHQCFSSLACTIPSLLLPSPLTFLPLGLGYHTHCKNSEWVKSSWKKKTSAFFFFSSTQCIFRGRWSYARNSCTANDTLSEQMDAIGMHTWPNMTLALKACCCINLSKQRSSRLRL